jgi:hypothetical protein
MKYLFSNSYSGRYHREKFYKGAKSIGNIIAEGGTIALMFALFWVCLVVFHN